LPEMTLRLTKDHDRIAEGLNDIVVHRLFSAGLALEAALALIGEHRAAGRIQHAISELDRAIGALRDTVFDYRRLDQPASGKPE
jgi:two-component system sensor histidine kinase DevS